MKAEIRPRRKTLIAILLIVIGSALLWHDHKEILPWLRSLTGETPQPAQGDSPQGFSAKVQKRPIEDIWASGDVLSTMAVAIERNPDWLRRLLDKEGIDPNLKLVHQKGTRWAHPLEKAARHGTQETFDILLAAGADPNGQSSGGFTALHAAARRGSLGIVEQLLAAGADPDLLSDAGAAPLDFAARWGHREIVEALLAEGAEMRLALYAAASGGQVEIVRLLLERGASPEVGEGHETPLDVAIAQGHDEVVALLVAAGAKPTGPVGEGGKGQDEGTPSEPTNP